jgi:hypothetical protein
MNAKRINKQWISNIVAISISASGEISGILGLYAKLVVNLII